MGSGHTTPATHAPAHFTLQTEVDPGQSWFGSTEPGVQCPEMFKWYTTWQCHQTCQLAQQLFSCLELERQKAPFNVTGPS